MAVKYHNDGTGYRLKAKGKTAEWIRRCIGLEGFGLGPVNYVFCSRERHLEINRQFLGHDYHTDVITFDYSDLSVRQKVAGDIFIDPETVAENAALYGFTAEEEMRRVLIHGALHLCGYGDGTEKEQALMRAKEDRYLALFDTEHILQ